MSDATSLEEIAAEFLERREAGAETQPFFRDNSG